jgi:hypothetical protein
VWGVRVCADVAAAACVAWRGVVESACAAAWQPRTGAAHRARPVSAAHLDRHHLAPRRAQSQQQIKHDYQLLLYALLAGDSRTIDELYKLNRGLFPTMEDFIWTKLSIVAVTGGSGGGAADGGGGSAAAAASAAAGLPPPAGDPGGVGGLGLCRAAEEAGACAALWLRCGYIVAASRLHRGCIVAA